LAGLSLLAAVLNYWVMKPVNPGETFPLPIDQALGGAALFALAHPVVGSGGRHPVVAEITA